MSYSGQPTRYQEPPLRRTQGGHQGKHEQRWRWWYASIADLMIRNPDWTMIQIAQSLNKHPNTVSMIVGTDLFREFLAQRKAAWREDHDMALRSRLTSVAAESLDIVLDQLRTKKSQIPLQAALKVTESALDRLGYAPASAQVVIDQRQIDNRQQTLVQVTAEDLEAARAAMRVAEQAKSGSSILEAPSPSNGLGSLGACGAGLDAIDVEVLDGEVT